MAVHEREHGGANEGEAETHPVDARAVRIAAGERHEDGNGGAERSDLGE